MRIHTLQPSSTGALSVCYVVSRNVRPILMVKNPDVYKRHEKNYLSDLATLAIPYANMSGSNSGRRVGRIVLTLGLSLQSMPLIKTCSQLGGFYDNLCSLIIPMVYLDCSEMWRP